MSLLVTIPAGVTPGELLAVTDGDRQFEVIVPDGSFAGDEITVSLEDFGPPDETEPENPHATGMELVEVMPPEGVAPGQTFTVTAAWGETFDVTLPDGHPAGTALLLELPLPSIAEGSSSPPGQRAPSSQGRDLHSPSPKRKRNARISRERRASREVPVGHLSRTASRRPSHEPAAEAADAEGTQPPSRLASPGGADVAGEWQHRYRAGARVMVLRTSGSYSAGRVLTSFEGCFDVLYQVRLESGQVKQAVPEEELYSADDPDDVGYGEHLMGAMLAAMEADGDDGGLMVMDD